MVQRLIELGAGPNASGRRGFNALLPAAMAADAEAVVILLDAGVDPTYEIGGMTLRRWLLNGAARAAEHPDDNPWFPSLTDPAAFERILELLEAAEARWQAGEQSKRDPGGRGGP